MFSSEIFTPMHSFTSGIEGPACDRDGNLYAVNSNRQHTIGMVTPIGVASILLELPNGSIVNDIRFNYAGAMFIADYVNHNIFIVAIKTQQATIFTNEPAMNQPNDIAIGANDIRYASDPN